MWQGFFKRPTCNCLASALLNYPKVNLLHVMSSRDHVFLISLGCAKNLVDSEHMLGILKSRGFELVSDIEQAEIAVINTCGFIHPAVDEAVDTILEIAAIKKQGKLKKL